MENEKQAIDIPTNIPLLPIRDVVIYPYMILPLFVGRGLSIKAVDEALNKDRYIFLAAQKDSTVEEPEEDQIYTVGTVAMVIRMLKLPDGRVKILVQGVAKARIRKLYKDDRGFYTVDIEKIEEPEIKEVTVGSSHDALGRAVERFSAQGGCLAPTRSPSLRPSTSAARRSGCIEPEAPGRVRTCWNHRPHRAAQACQRPALQRWSSPGPSPHSDPRRR